MLLRNTPFITQPMVIKKFKYTRKEIIILLIAIGAFFFFLEIFADWDHFKAGLYAGFK